MSTASVSVVATAAVAIAAMALQAWLDRSRRRHELHLALQERRIDVTNEFVDAVEQRHNYVTTMSATRRRDPLEPTEEELQAEITEGVATLGAVTTAVRRLRLVMPPAVRDEADQLIELADGVRSFYGHEIDIMELVAHDQAMTDALRTFQDHIAAVIQSDT